MSSTRRNHAVLVAVLALATSVLTGCAGEAAANENPATGKSIRLYEHDTQQATSDLGARGPGIGDLFIFAGDVFDRPGGHRLGRARGNCTTVSGNATTPGDLQCTIVFVLDGGQIVVNGLFDSTALFSGTTLPVAVTGGTALAQDLLAWCARLALPDSAAGYEQKRVRLRILTTAGRLVRTARRRALHIDPTWPWAATITLAHARLCALPVP